MSKKLKHLIEFKLFEGKSLESEYLYYKELVDAGKKKANNSSGGENEMDMENLVYNRKMMNRAKASLKKAGKEIPKK